MRKGSKNIWWKCFLEPSRQLKWHYKCFQISCCKTGCISQVFFHPLKSPNVQTLQTHPQAENITSIRNVFSWADIIPPPFMDAESGACWHAHTKINSELYNLKLLKMVEKQRFNNDCISSQTKAADLVCKRENHQPGTFICCVIIPDRVWFWKSWNYRQTQSCIQLPRIALLQRSHLRECWRK